MPDAEPGSIRHAKPSSSCAPSLFVMHRHISRAPNSPALSRWLRGREQPQRQRPDAERRTVNCRMLHLVPTATHRTKTHPRHFTVHLDQCLSVPRQQRVDALNATGLRLQPLQLPPPPRATADKKATGQPHINCPPQHPRPAHTCCENQEQQERQAPTRKPPAAKKLEPCPPPPSRPRRIDRAEIPCPLIYARTIRPPGRRPTAAIVSRYCGDASPVPLYADPQSRLPLSSFRRLFKAKPTTTLKTPAYGPHKECLRRQTLRVKRGERS